ncbi:MAG: outer membrane protein assembly factor BamD [Rudaea sp.]|uniref:outer membrane protein assembly factor BamD n=1 Tax=unclassified Rudaea TaxID=2627037 RepID=UPI00148540AF|nr:MULTISPECIES: outer membrane protein assembly factor BamD [unclassified Rudaea]MBN8886538.1 outer membrane protein assembly factor BamD [Rudaea sp.]
MRLSPLVKLFVLLLLAVFAVGCHRDKKQDETETLPVEQLYQGAKDALMQGNETKAIRYYQRLIARFPFGPYTEQSQMELAFAQYKDGKNDEALSTINRFIKTYPTQKNVAYAYYLRGIINFDRDRGFLANWANQDPTKREMASTLQSFEDFSELVTKYPDSRYTPDARLRMIYLRDNMSRAQIYVAKFYYKRGAYVAAINRCKDILERFDRTPAAGDALAVMVLSYKALGQDKLAGDSERVLKLNYPDHPYFAGNWPSYGHWWARLVPFHG